MNPNPLAIWRDIEQPPGGWRYTVPETGMKLTGATPKTLRNRIGDHLRANGLPVPDNDTLDSRICEFMALGAPYCGPPVKDPVEGIKKNLTLNDAHRFLKTVLAAVQARRFVSREEAQRRMAVCAKCPLAGNIGGCLTCSGLISTIVKLVAGLVPEGIPGRPFCLACGCLVRAKVTLPNDVLDEAEEGNTPAYHADCWRLSPHT